MLVSTLYNVVLPLRRSTSSLDVTIRSFASSCKGIETQGNHPNHDVDSESWAQRNVHVTLFQIEITGPKPLTCQYSARYHKDCTDVPFMSPLLFLLTFLLIRASIDFTFYRVASIKIFQAASSFCIRPGALQQNRSKYRTTPLSLPLYRSGNFGREIKVRPDC